MWGVVRERLDKWNLQKWRLEKWGCTRGTRENAREIGEV
jgi:hypothetical protein